MRLGVWGDSITASFGNAWQKVVLARTGAQLVYQDAREGRTFENSLECYGAPDNSASSTVGNYNPANIPAFCGPAGVNIGYKTGESLAQNLANVDLMIVALGTNDTVLVQDGHTGTLSDDMHTDTLYGAMCWLLCQLHQANPAMRILVVTANGKFETPAMPSAVILQGARDTAADEVIFANYYGDPACNMQAEAGSNLYTYNTLTRDGVHPSDFAYSLVYGPKIASCVLAAF